MKIRPLSFFIHRYLGILVAVLLILLGLTGSLLVFYLEIDHWLNPHLFNLIPQETSVSVDVLVDKVKLLYPNLTLETVSLPEAITKPYQISFSSSKDEWIDIYVNPYTAEILANRTWGKTLVSWFYNFHYSLSVGDIGSKIVGGCGFILAILGVTGIRLWSGWRKLATGFKIRWNSSSRVVNYDLHQVTGIFSSFLLILIAITGSAMIFYSSSQALLYSLTLTPKPPELKSTVVPNQIPLPVSQLLKIADQALPDAPTTYLSIPHEADGVVRVTKKFAQEINTFGKTRIFIDQYKGEVLRIDNALVAPIPEQILNWLLPLHSGSFGGLPVRILYVLIGLTPTLLGVTGFVLWRQRQWVNARRREILRQSQLIEEEAIEIQPLATSHWF